MRAVSTAHSAASQSTDVTGGAGVGYVDVPDHLAERCWREAPDIPRGGRTPTLGPRRRACGVLVGSRVVILASAMCCPTRRAPDCRCSRSRALGCSRSLWRHRLPPAVRERLVAEEPCGVTDRPLTVLYEFLNDSNDIWMRSSRRLSPRVVVGVPATATARVDLEQDRAWRLYTKGITPREAEAAATFMGDHHLGRRLLHAVAIIA
jgi:hypothetical protein